MNKKFLRYDNPLWALLGAVLFLLVFSWSTSPWYKVFGHDSPFFEIIGLGVVQGKIPYVDLFDHKGPLIFFIDALGFSFGIGKTGVFLLQVVFMSFTLFFLYKLAALFTKGPKQAFAAVALTLIPLADFLCEGNQCEEWMLPFIASSLYLVCNYIKNDGGRFPFWKSLYLGAAFAIIFYTRPNDAVMQVGAMCLGVFIYWIGRKQYGELLPAAAGFLSSCVLVSIPIWGWFWSKNAVGDFIYGMIVHNLRYTGDALFSWGGIGMILIPAVIVGAILLLDKKNGRSMWFIFIPILAATVILIGKRDYYHYLIPFIPTVAACFAMALEGRWKKFLWVVCVLFAVFSYRQCKTIVKAVAQADRVETFYRQTDALFEKVPESERNYIWNYNLWVLFEEHSPHLIAMLGAWLHKGITPGNTDFVWFQSDYKDKVVTVRDAEPKWLVLTRESGFNQDFDWIFENYELVAETPAEPACVVELYKRK